MCGKFILIYIFCYSLIETINAQSHGTTVNGGDMLTNLPSAETGIHSPNTASQSQAYSNVDQSAHPVQPVPVQHNPPVPEPLATFHNQENADDVARSARGAQIGGFGNGIPSSGFIGTPIVTGPVANGIEGLTRMSEGIPLAPQIIQPQNVLAPPVEGFRDINGLIRTDGLTPGFLGPVNSIPGGIMPPGQIANTLLNTAVGINNGVFPTTPMNIGNAITAIQSNGMAGVPIHGELKQFTIPNPLVNSVQMSGIANSLPNPATISRVSNSFLRTPTGTLNGLKAFETPFSNVPTTLPLRSYAESKSILASLTGIDPASLGTRAKFMVKSASPISPTGLAVQAENLVMEGKLAVTGKMPFLGSVTVDGVLPDGGKGTVMYECGNSNIGIVSETTAPVAMGQTNSFARTGVTGNFNNANINRFGLRNNVF